MPGSRDRRPARHHATAAGPGQGGPRPWASARATGRPAGSPGLRPAAETGWRGPC